MTDHDLKLFLARKLPEKIVASADKYFDGREMLYIWKDTGKEVTEREWDWVAREAVLQLNDEQHFNYRKLLYDTHGSRGREDATWQQRTCAIGKWKD